MTEQQWKVAWKLYESGSSVPPEEVHSFLRNATGDVLVRDAVIAMLERAKGVARLDTMGRTVGRYIVTERLGEGGMGEVPLRSRSNTSSSSTRSRSCTDRPEPGLGSRSRSRSVTRGG
jgi:hypothetical protein